MSDLTITIELPEALVERARSVGMQLETQTDQIITMLEAQIRRREAAKRLTDIAQQLQSLPPDLKPSPQDIEKEIRAHWADNDRT